MTIRPYNGRHGEDRGTSDRAIVADRRDLRKPRRRLLHARRIVRPRYTDAFEPEIGIATPQLLERLGCDGDCPLDQTCCGQPMTNTGCHAQARATEELFAQLPGYECIVAPSDSCVPQVRTRLSAASTKPRQSRCQGPASVERAAPRPHGRVRSITDIHAYSSLHP
jgi:hypothetical protein